MIKSLLLTNVGPFPVDFPVDLEFSPRLNIITGDNGLGKSFLLDICWWALTQTWPQELNTKLTIGRRAIPDKEGKITCSFSTKTKDTFSFESIYKPKEERWSGKQGRPTNPGLVIYALNDGSFAVWDPARNYWKKEGNKYPAYVFNTTDVWEGLSSDDSKWLCNGLIRDWSSWQKENGNEFDSLKKVLESLSSPTETMTPGELTRIDTQDVRDIPTICMPYGQEVPVIHASSAMRRIMALAYLIVWTWEEHKKASKIRQEETTNQIIFLFDEIESHLHPKWQRKIVPALLSVMELLMNSAQVQFISATHSPLVMASIESLFNNEKDTWFDLDLKDGNVLLQKNDFEKNGEANSWFQSDAFDLLSTRDPKYEELLNEASQLLKQEKPDKQKIKTMTDDLVAALNPKDIYLFNWRNCLQKKGLL